MDQKEPHSEECVKSDRAMQLLQIIMLSALMGGGGYISNAVLEGQRIISKMGLQLERNTEEHRTMLDELRGNREAIVVLDRRVTVIETKAK